MTNSIFLRIGDSSLFKQQSQRKARLTPNRFSRSIMYLPVAQSVGLLWFKLGRCLQNRILRLNSCWFGASLHNSISVLAGAGRQQWYHKIIVGLTRDATHRYSQLFCLSLAHVGMNTNMLWMFKIVRYISFLPGQLIHMNIRMNKWFLRSPDTFTTAITMTPIRTSLVTF